MSDTPNLGTCEALLLTALDIQPTPHGINVNYAHTRCRRPATRVIEGPNASKPGQLARTLLCDYHAESLG